MYFAVPTTALQPFAGPVSLWILVLSVSRAYIENWDVIPPIPPEMNLDDGERSAGSDTLSQYFAKNFLDCSYETNLIADSWRWRGDQ